MFEAASIALCHVRRKDAARGNAEKHLLARVDTVSDSCVGWRNNPFGDASLFSRVWLLHFGHSIASVKFLEWLSPLYFSMPCSMLAATTEPKSSVYNLIHYL